MKLFPFIVWTDSKECELRVDFFYAVLHGCSAQGPTECTFEDTDSLGGLGGPILDDLGFVEDDAVPLRVEEEGWWFGKILVFCVFVFIPGFPFI